MIDIFGTRTMLEAVEQMKRPSMWLRDTFFPGFRQFDTEAVDIDIVKGKRRIAPFVSPLAEGRVVERLGFSTETLKPGYLKPKMPTTAADLLKRGAGEILYGGGVTIEQRAQAQLGKDLGDLLDQIDRREEWLAAQALDAGAVTMTIKGETTDKTVQIDFQMAADHKVTLAGNDLWSDTTNSDPLAKLSEWARKCRQDSGISPDTVVLGSDAAEKFLRHPKVTAELNLIRVNTGQIDVSVLPNGVSYLGHITRPGLDVAIYSYDEWYVDDAGTEQSMVPAKKVWMGSSRAQNTKLYAVIQDIEAIEGGQAAVQRFPKSWITKDPAVRWLMLQSAPLMALNQPDAFLSAQVLA